MGEKKDLKAKNRLSDVDVIEMGLVDQGAVPDAKFVVLKAKDINLPEGSDILIKYVAFKAVDKVKKQVYGYCLVPILPDYQGDTITAEEVEKAAHRFMQNAAVHKLKGQGTSDQHSYFDGIGYVCESTIDYHGVIGKAAGMDEGIQGGWWIGVQVENDELWDKIEKGEKTGFSIGGTGVREPVDASKPESAVGKVLSKITGIFEFIRKGDSKSFQEIYDAQQVNDDLWDMFFALNDSIRSIVEDSDVTDKVAAISSTIEQFRAAIIAYVSIIKAGAGGDQQATNQDIVKQLSEIITKLKSDSTEDPEGGTDVDVKQFDQLAKTVGELQKKLDEEILPTLKKLADNGEGEGGTPANGDPPQDGAVTDEAVTKLMEQVTALAKKLDEDVIERLNKLESTPGVRKSLEPGQTVPDPKDGKPDDKVPSLRKSMFAGVTRPMETE